MVRARTRRVVTLARGGNRPACAMLPGLGGGIDPYMHLAAHLGQTHDVYVVRAAGLVPGEEPENCVEAMARSSIEALDAMAIAPELVFGWSLGGAIGWEACVQLANRGQLPSLVLVDSSPLPLPPAIGDDARTRVFEMLGPRVAPATFELVRRTVDAQLEAAGSYRARRCYAGPVLMLMCSQSGDRAAAAARWRALAPELHTGWLTADHFAVLRPAHLEELTHELSTFLTATGQSRRTARKLVAGGEVTW